MDKIKEFEIYDIELEEQLDEAKFQYWLHTELRIQPKEYALKILHYLRNNSPSLNLEMNIILSIKPKYVEKIFEGTKKYEFRKKIFKSQNISKIYIYCSYPIKRIVGYFRKWEIIEDSPINLWKQCKEQSGLTKTEFFSYFHGKIKGFSIKIEELNIFEEHINPIEIFPNFKPPQSFCYFEGEI